jgi:hypothetical protein
MGQDSMKHRILYIRELCVPTRTRGETKEVGRQAACKVTSENRPPFPSSYATNRANGDTGVSKVEKLIEAGYEDGPKEPNHPCAKGIGWHLHVVRVGDGGPHFGVGRLVFPF